MSAAPLRSRAQRRRLLRAMGMQPMRWRGVAGHGAAEALAGAAETPQVAAAVADSSSPAAAACVPLALVLPAGADPRVLDLLGRALQAAGSDFARAPRLDVEEGRLRQGAVHARAYLTFGEAQARALGRELPVAVMAAAEVMLVDEPSVLLGAGGKRRLWSAMHALWRRMRLDAGA